MKELLSYIITHALPEGVEFNVRQRETEVGVTLEVSIPSEYRGKIIGKGGHNIKAIRDVLNILAYEQNKRVFLKILD